MRVRKRSAERDTISVIYPHTSTSRTQMQDGELNLQFIMNLEERKNPFVSLTEAVIRLNGGFS